VTPRRPKVEPIPNPTLFETGRLEWAPQLETSLNVQRPYSEPGLLLGTSSFTAAGWQGSFYPPGMQTRNFLRYMNWYESAKQAYWPCQYPTS
jgi:hypothetical protein